jgi:cytochrome c biogenesis protein CcmG, thiol:disulfide interchange protein DsbE
MASSSKASNDRTRWVMIGGGVLVLVIAIVVAVLSSGEVGSAVRVDDLAGSPELAGAPLPGAPEAGAEDPAIGEPAPRVTGADFDGTPVTIGEPGTPQLIMFMASWCPACQEELRTVSPWLQAGGLPDGVTLTAVATLLDDTRPNWPPDAWFESEGFTDPVLVDDRDASVATAYGLRATPYWVALDAEGQVVARVSGMVPIEGIEQLAQAALAGA